MGKKKELNRRREERSGYFLEDGYPSPLDPRGLAWVEASKYSLIGDEVNSATRLKGRHWLQMVTTLGLAFGSDAPMFACRNVTMWTAGLHC